MDPVLEIKMVRENLALAVGIWAAAKKGMITTLHLPQGRVVVTSDAGRVVEVPSLPELNGDQDLVRCVANQARGAFALSVMQMQRTFDKLSGTPPLEEPDPDLRAARCTIFLLNHSLGQDMVAPAWTCPPVYRQRFEVQPISFALDASALNGNPVLLDDFGGLAKFLDLLDYCIGKLPSEAPAQIGCPQPEGAEVQAAEDRTVDTAVSAKPPDAFAGSLPMGDFIAARCAVGPDAQIKASDLYAAYLAWCQEIGRAALVQRNFGMSLTALGYNRRRRGRGRHWWQGIQVANPESA